jgi:hypothetical protein
MKHSTLFFVFSLLFFLVFASLFFVVKNPAIAKANHSEKSVDFNGKTLDYANGAVINIWIDSFPRLDTLRERNVRYLFVDVGETGKDGTIATPEYEIKNFLGFMQDYERITDYHFVLLPYSEVNTANYNINSETFRNNFVEDYVRLNNLGFDGVLVDIENMQPDQRDSYIIILDRLRVDLPKGSIISAYAAAVGSYDNPWEWEPSFYRSVSDRVDLISASGYDSDKVTKEDYQDYIRGQVDFIASGNFSPYFLFAVPTHKAPPETIENALSAYTSELQKYPSNKFLGICVFAEWTADDNEWVVIDKFI